MFSIETFLKLSKYALHKYLALPVSYSGKENSFICIFECSTFVVSLLFFRDNIEPTGCRNTDHKFVMFTFEKPQTCNHCSKFLKGRIFQVC